MPYLMGGFPDLETSLAVAESYAEAGADVIELGVPFSDPLADGPVIHAAATRALAAGATLERVLSICERLAGRLRWCRWCTRTWCSRAARASSRGCSRTRAPPA